MLQMFTYLFTFSRLQFQLNDVP